MGLFKTNISGKYVHTTIGNDLTGTGDRNNPYATIAAVGSAYQGPVILSGKSTETSLALTSGLFQLYGDNDAAEIMANISNITGNGYVFTDVKISGDISSIYQISVNRCRLALTTGGPSTSQYRLLITNSFINDFKAKSYGADSSINNECVNNTILRYFNYCYLNTARTLKDTIIIESVDLYNYTSRSTVSSYPIFKNCLFRKATVWKWNGTPITINWAGAGATLMEKVYNSLLVYANTIVNTTDKAYALAVLNTQATMFQDCIVYDDTDAVNNPIFSRYVGGVPADYTLALKSNNPALYTSTVNSYIGCYAANVNDDGTNLLAFGKPKNVTIATGNDTAAAGVEDGTLLIQDVSNQAKFSASQSSTQLWNRIRTSVVAYPRGKSFAGMQSQLDSGLASRLFFGKRQEIITSGDINQKTTAFESIEVIPYDSIPANNTTLATIDTITLAANIPRFSAPFNGECLMFYKAAIPLLFNSNNNLRTLFTGSGTVAITSGSPTVTGTSTTFLADFVKDDNIRINGVDYKVLSVTSNTILTLTANTAATLSGQTYSVGVQVDKSQTIYGTWAVTNADIESYSLLQKATKAGLTTSIPLIKYAKFELNLHYEEE